MSSKFFKMVVVWGSLFALVGSACNGASDAKKKQNYDGDDNGGASSGNGKNGAGENQGNNAGNGSNTGGDADGAGGADAGQTAGETGQGAGGDANGTGGSGAGGDRNGTDTAIFPKNPGPIDEGGALTWRGTTGTLVLQVGLAQSPAVVGQPLEYTLLIGNTGNVAVKGVSLLFRVPKGEQFYYTSPQPASSYCGNAVCTENEEATWDFGDIPAGAVRSIQLDPSVLNNIGDGDTLAPQIRLSATGLDPLTVSPSTPVVSSAPVEVTLGASAEPVIAGDEVELSVDIGHIGDAGLFTGKLQLDLPGWLGVEDVSDGGTSELAAGKTSINWSIDSVPVGSSFRRLIKAKVSPDVTAGDLLNPRASFTYEAAVVPSVAQFPMGAVGKASPLKLEIVAAEDPVVPGAAATYLVTVSNPSQRAVDGVTLVARVATEESYYFSATEPDSTYCGNAVCTGDELSGWGLGTLQAGTSETITIEPGIVAQAAGDGTLISTYFELDALNMTSLHRLKTIAAHAKPSAQLVLGTAYSPATPGQSFTYDLDVGQVGLGSLQSGALKLELPPQVSAGSASDGGVVQDGVVSWDLGAIAVSQTLHRSIEVKVADGTPVASILKARATLTYNGGQERDAVSEFALPLVTEALPLDVKLASVPGTIVLGNTESYTTTIKNTAARSIDGVTLLLRLPPGNSFYYTTGADPDSSYCSNAVCSDYEEATWALGTMTAGSTKVVNVNPSESATLVAGSLVTFRQRLTAVDLGGTIMLQTTVPTKK